MTLTISNMEDFRSLWPDDAAWEVTSEVHTSCPFCIPVEGKTLWRDDVSFVGESRFVISNSGAFCRYCLRNGTAPRHITFKVLAERLHGTLSVDFESSISVPTSISKPEVVTDTTLADAHANVARRYWKQFGWTDGTINRFKLGLYDMYYDTAYHVIPYKAVNTETDCTTSGWVFEGRMVDEDGIKHTRRSTGVRSEYVFFIHEAPDDTSVIITEGIKDGVSAYQMGFRNILSISGATIWAKEKSLFLARHGFKSALVAGDNDAAGKAFDQDVIDRNAMAGITTSRLNWSEELRLKYDLTDLLSELGIDEAFKYISENAEIIKSQRITWTSLEPRPVSGQKVQEYIEVDELRGTGERSIQYNLSTFISRYKEKTSRGYGALLLLNASPGTGKTHTLVRTIEPIAAKRRETVQIYKESLLVEIASIQQRLSENTDTDNQQADKDMLETLQRRVSETTFSSVLWFAKFRKSTADLMELALDPTLWFDYEGRNPDNCGNYAITQELGQKNHDIRSFCETACPLRDACRQHGYLSQDERMKEKSITIVRHQNLINEGLIKMHKDLVVVDESPLDVIESPMLIERRTLAPVTETWYMQLNNDPEFPSVRSAVLLVESIKHIMDTVEETGDLCGTELLKRLNAKIVALDSRYTLDSVMGNLEQSVFDDYYQPTYLVSGVTTIYYRTMPFLYRALAKEYMWFKSHPDADTDISQITISRNRFSQVPVITLLQMKTPKIRSTTPIVVADATTREPELYQIGFDRRVDVYAPETRNPNLVEHVFFGRDFTTSYRTKKFGDLIRDKKNVIVRKAESITGQTIDLDKIEQTGDTYDDNKTANDYFDMITYVAAHNESCLVVTHKDMQDLLEPIFRARYPVMQERVKWGHFGALRGDNQYKDLTSAVIFGVPRIPYDAIAKRARAWSAIGGNYEKMGQDMHYVEDPYGTYPMGNEHITFINPFATRLVDIQEKGEIQQATERIRPHVTKDVKHVYYCMTRPMDAKNISEIRTFSDVMGEWRTEQRVGDAVNYILKAIQTTGKRPTINEVRRVSHLQYEDAKKAFMDIQNSHPQLYSGAN